MNRLLDWLRGWIAKRVVRVFEPGFDFDRYMKERGLGPKDGPAALAAWLHEAYGWDGDVRKIDP